MKLMHGLALVFGAFALSASAATLQLNNGDVVTITPNTTTTVSCSAAGGPISGIECKVDSDCASNFRCNSVGKCVQVDPCSQALTEIQTRYKNCKQGHSASYCADSYVINTKQQWGRCAGWSGLCFDSCIEGHSSSFCSDSCN